MGGFSANMYLKILQRLYLTNIDITEVNGKNYFSSIKTIILLCGNTSTKSLKFKIYSYLDQAMICLQVDLLIFDTFQATQICTAIKNIWSVWSSQQMLTHKLFWQLTDRKKKNDTKQCLPGSNLKQQINNIYVLRISWNSNTNYFSFALNTMLYLFIYALVIFYI